MRVFLPLLAAITLAIVVASRGGEEPQVPSVTDQVSGPSEGSIGSEGGNPRLGANSGKESPATALHDEAVDSLELLFDAVPPGTPSEWVIQTLGTGATPYPEAHRCFEETVGSDRLEQPPYRAAFVFGPSDLPWLRRVHSLFQSELTELVAASGADLSRQALLTDDLKAHYWQVLSDVALKRVQRDAVTQRRISSGVMLKDLRDADDQAWLRAMIEVVAAPTLWQGAEGPTASDKALVSGRDLQFLRDLTREVMEVRFESSPSVSVVARRHELDRIRDTLASHLSGRH